MLNLSIFAERLKELIEESGKSIDVIAAEMNHNVYDLYHWQSGKSRYLLSVKNFVMLADYFGCSLTFLLGIDDVNTLPSPRRDIPPFSERFAAVLKEKGMSVYALAAKAGVSNTSVYYDWLNGKKSPRIDSLLKTAAAIGVTPDYLLGREN